MPFFDILILYCLLLLLEIADAYDTGKVSPACKTACTKDNKLFIWRKKNSQGVGTIVKIKVKIPSCFAELLLCLTICSVCNLYCQSSEFKGGFLPSVCELLFKHMNARLLVRNRKSHPATIT